MAENNLDSLIPEAPAEGSPKTPADLIPDHNELQKQGMQQSMFVAGQTDPDKFADAVNLADKYKVDPFFAHDNMDELKKSDAGKNLNYDNLIQNYPGTTNFLQKPENASLAHDDTDNLNRIDHATQIVSKKNGFLQDIGNSTMSGFNDLQKFVVTFQAAHGLIDPEKAADQIEALDKESAQLKSLTPDYVKEYQAAMTANKNDLTKALSQFGPIAEDLKNGSITKALQDYAAGEVPTLGSLLDFAKTFATSPRADIYNLTGPLAEFLPSIALGALGTAALPEVLGGSAIAATVGGIGGSFMGAAPILVGQKFNQLLEESGKTPREAFNDPKLMSEFRSKADAYGTTFASILALTGGLGGAFAKEGVSLAEPGIASTLGSAARFGAGAATQAAGIAGGEAAGNVAAGEKFDGPATIQSFLTMLGVGAAMEALPHAAKVGVSRETFTPTGADIIEPPPPKAPEGETITVEPERKLLAEKRSEYSPNPVEAIQQVANDTQTAVHTAQSLQAMKEMGDAVKESKLAQRVPDKIEEMVKASGGEGNIFFQSDDWDKYWTKKGLSPAKAAEQILNDGGVAYQTAKETGQDMPIPLSTYVSKVAPTEHYDALLGVVKTEPNGMKYEDAKAHMAAVPETVKTIANEAGRVKDEAKTLADRAYDQLIAAGRSPEEAKAASQIIESRLNARSSITGISPQTHFDKYGFEITHEEGQTLAEQPKQILEQSDLPTKELQFQRYLETPQAIEDYAKIPETMNGNYIGQDVARGLLPEYNHSRESRILNIEATQRPTVKFAQKLYDHNLDRKNPGTVHIVMGPNGAGKSTSIEGDLKSRLKGSDFIFETIGRDYSRAAQNISNALKKGWKVHLSFVYRPFDEAIQGIVNRYYSQGRSVDAIRTAEAHVNSNETFLNLNDKFKDRQGFSIEIVNNSKGLEGQPMTLTELKKTGYIKSDETAQQAAQRLTPGLEERYKDIEAEIRALRSGEISQLQSGASALSSGSESQGLPSSETLNPKKLNQGPNERGPRGSIEFGPYKALIKLGENADASTFIHESFHQWTKEFIDDFNHLKDQENLSDRQKQFMADGQNLLKYVGASSFEEMTTAQWEKIAESGEEYVREGKAPTPELQGAFARFKTWISYLYRAFKNNSIKLTDDIRAVFDRMLASEDEAAKENFNPLFKEDAVSGMTEKQAAEYTDLKNRIDAEREDKLRASLMKNLKRQNSKDYSMAKDIIRNRVTDMVNKDPVYRAISVLKDGVLPDGSELPVGTYPVKLSKEAIIEEYGKDYISGLPTGIFDKETGLPADMVAESFGFSSGEDLLHSLANAPTKKSVIEEMTDAEMKRQYPDLTEQPQLSDEAVKAAANDLKSKALHLELETLAQMPGFKKVVKDIARRVPTDIEIRMRAQNILNKIPLNQISSYTFELAERKASKQAGEALAKGDIEGAYQAKNRELLNHELYKAAVNANEVVSKAETLFKKVARKDEDLAKGRDVDLVNAARALLAQYSLGRTKKSPMEYLEKIRAYNPDKFATLSDLLGSISQIPKDYRTLSFEDFMNLKHSFDALWTLAKTENEIKVEGKQFDKQIAIEGIKSDLQRYREFKKIPESSVLNRTRTRSEEKKMDLAAAKASGRIAESLIDQLSLGKIDSSLRKFLFDVVEGGTEGYHEAKIKTQGQLDKLLKSIEKSMKLKKIEAKEIGYTFGDKSNLLMALLHSGNESNLSKLIRGRGWGEYDEEGNLNRSRWDAFISRAQKEGILTKADYDFAQGVWDLFETLKVEAQASFKEQFGYHFEEITAKPFKAFDQEYRGGYMPAKVDPYESPLAKSREEKNSFEKIENTWAFPTTGKGFTKSRVDEYAEPLSLDLSRLPGALDWELRFIHIEPKTQQVAKLLWDKDVRAAIDSVHPHAVHEVLVPWLQRAAQQIVTFPSGNRFVDTAARYLKTSTQMQYLALNISSAAKRLTGLFPATLKVPASDLRDGFMTFVMNPKETTRKIQEKSTFMRVHTSEQLSEIQESTRQAILNPSIFQKAQEIAKPYTSLFIKTVQHMTDMTVWQGAYNHAIETAPKGMDAETMESRAVKAADSAVRLTQGSSFPEHVSRWATGTPFQNLFKMFVNHFNTIGNLQVSEQAQAKGYSKKAYVFAAGFIAFAVTGAWIEAILHGASGKKDDQSWMNYLFQHGINGMLGVGGAFIPTAGPALNSAAQYLLNPKSSPADFHVELSPAISILGSDVKGLASLKDSIIKHRPLKGREISDIFTLLGQGTGLPLGPISRPFSYITDVNQHNIKQPSGPIDLVRGLATGKGHPVKK